MGAISGPFLAVLVLDFGAYAPFVWGSYGATAAILGALILWISLRNRRIRRELETIERRAGRDGASLAPEIERDEAASTSSVGAPSAMARQMGEPQ